jgi:predicted nucleotidyltransferase
MAVFRSHLQGELLARVFLAPQAASVSDLARGLDAPVATVHREVTRLAQAGILTTSRFGRALVVTANDDNPALAALRELVLIAFGPRQVVDEEFAALNGLTELMIFGSWAARYRGESGPVPGDVDVLVVGAVDRDEVFDAAERASRRLQREVNPTVVSPRRWAEGDEPFLQQIRARPSVVVVERQDETEGSS